jgi:hypothetical protein
MIPHLTGQACGALLNAFSDNKHSRMRQKSLVLILSNPVAPGDGTANEYIKDKKDFICSK